jgi:iron complex outermembrane receptor protein
MRLRRALIASTCLAAGGALLPIAAEAQTLAASGPAATAAADASASAASTHQVQEVVVTAERRATSLQHTALAITAVSGKSLDQSFTNNIAGLNATVPSLEITKASGFENLVTIRGVGSETPENSLTTSPGVSEFVDGVYIANTISLDETLFDVDRIEVLRGPQGSLYGQSSIGGAINIVTNQPKLHEFSGAGDFSIGNYDLFRERAEVNLPLGDAFAARLSVQKYDHSGFTKDAAMPGFKLDSAHDVSGKVALLWKPTDDFTATLTGQWYHSAQSGDAQKNINDPSTDPRVVNQDYPGHFALTTQLYHLNMQWDLPWFELKSVTAYQNLDHVQQEDSSRTTFALLHAENPLLGYDNVAGWNTTVHNLSEEFDILSLPGGKLDWIAGAFIQHQTSHQLVEEFEGTTPATADAMKLLPVNETTGATYPSNLNYGNDSHATHDSYALFAQATYHFTSKLRGTLGARYNMDSNTNPSFNFSGRGPVGPGSFAKDNANWDAVPTWRAELDYDITPSNMVYFNQARGYKPGGSNGNSSAYVLKPTFQPETNTSFELGSKNYFFDRSLRINVSAFYYIHKNFQYIETDPIPFNGGIANIPSVHDYGVEFEGAYVGMDDRLNVNLNLAYERGEVNGVYKTIDSTVANYLEGPTYSGGNSDGFDAAHAYGACAYYADYYSSACWKAVAASAVNIQGKTPPAMPTISGSISASYTFDIPTGKLTPRVEVVYRGEEWARIFNDPFLDKVPAYTVTNFNIEYAPTGSKLRLSLAVTNAFNVAGVNSRYTDPYGTAQTSQQYIPPQQFIGTIAFAF